MSKGKITILGKIIAVLTTLSLFFFAMSCKNTNITSAGNYSLTITATTRSVTKSPDKTIYASGEIVTLNAIARKVYSFANWSGDASGTSSTITITMNGNKSVTANFTGASSTGETVTDIDGNVYNTVKIGNQVWTVKNLRVTKYNDGSEIPLDTSRITWGGAEMPKYCFYQNTTNLDSIKKYGALYNWYVFGPANPKKIAPIGWHVPSDAEWDTLQNYLITNGYNWDGTTTGNKIAKSLAAKTDWYTYSVTGAVGFDLSKNNRSGFSALPGSYRSVNGDFNYPMYNGYWWSATSFGGSHACYRFLNYGTDYLIRDYFLKNCGCSLRLVRDN